MPTASHRSLGLVVCAATMLLSQRLNGRIRSGEITVAFRRWKRPTVVAGGTLQSPAGLLRIDEVAVIEPSEITGEDIAAAGFSSADALTASLRPGTDRQLYRIRFHHESEDPRIKLRTRTQMDPVEISEVRSQLKRWDNASTTGPWTSELLQHIARHPAQRSFDLAAQLGVDQKRLKRRVRQLKRLGLTESLGTGYKISPRGAAYICCEQQGR